MARARKHIHNCKQFRELLERYDFSPTEFIVARLADTKRKCDEWQSFLDCGQVPPEFGNIRPTEVQDMIDDNRQDVAGQCEKLLRHEFPTLADLDATVETTEKRISEEPLTDDEWESDHGLGAAAGTPARPN